MVLTLGCYIIVKVPVVNMNKAQAIPPWGGVWLAAKWQGGVQRLAKPLPTPSQGRESHMARAQLLMLG